MSRHATRSGFFGFFLCAVCIVAASSVVRAGDIIDPAGDILPTFAPADFSGTPGGDLDVLFATVRFNPDTQQFHLIARFNDAIGTTTNDLGEGAAYAWGFDRGGAGDVPGDGPFGDIGNPDIKFNAVVGINADGTGSVFAGGPPGVIDPSNISIVADTMTVLLDAALLPSTGFEFVDYLWNLWPRIGFGLNNQISDFAPDNAMERVQAIPEPSSILLLGLGAVAFGAVGWRRFRAG